MGERIAEKEQELQRAKDALAEAKEEADRLSHVVADLGFKRTALQGTLLELSEEQGRAMKSGQEIRTSIDDNKSSIWWHEKQLFDTKRPDPSFEAQRRTLEEKLAGLAIQAANEQEALATTQASLREPKSTKGKDDAEQTKSEKTGELNALELEKSSISLKIMGLNQQLATIAEQKKGDLEGQDLARTSQEKQLANTQQRLDQLQHELQRTQTSIDGNTSEASKLEQEQRALEQLIQQTEAELGQSKDEEGERLVVHERTQERLRTAQQEAEEKIALATQQLEEHKTQAEQLALEQSTLRTELDQALATKAEELRAQNYMNIAKLKAQRAQMDEEAKRAQQSCRESQQRLKELQAELGQLNDDPGVSALSIEIQATHAKLAAQKAELTALDDQQAETRARITAALEDLEGVQTQKAETEAALARFAHDMDQLNKAWISEKSRIVLAAAKSRLNWDDLAHQRITQVKRENWDKPRSEAFMGHIRDLEGFAFGMLLLQTSEAPPTLELDMTRARREVGRGLLDEPDQSWNARLVDFIIKNSLQIRALECEQNGAVERQSFMWIEAHRLFAEILRTLVALNLYADEFDRLVAAMLLHQTAFINVAYIQYFWTYLAQDVQRMAQCEFPPAAVREPNFQVRIFVQTATAQSPSDKDDRWPVRWDRENAGCMKYFLVCFDTNCNVVGHMYATRYSEYQSFLCPSVFNNLSGSRQECLMFSEAGDGTLWAGVLCMISATLLLAKSLRISNVEPSPLVQEDGILHQLASTLTNFKNAQCDVDTLLKVYEEKVPFVELVEAPDRIVPLSE